MATADMWWGQTSWWWPRGLSVNFGSQGIEVEGMVEGPDCGVCECGNRHETLGILGQYFLDTDRMPPVLPDEYIWRSSPEVIFSGDVAGMTFEDALFDSPSAKCKLRVKHLVLAGGTLITHTERVMDLMDISDDPWELERFDMPQIFRPYEIAFPLDRNKDLEIDIELRFEMFCEGGNICYSCWDDSDTFRIRVPQWSIVSMEPPD